jgi:hypothetical protein
MEGSSSKASHHVHINMETSGSKMSGKLSIFGIWNRVEITGESLFAESFVFAYQLSQALVYKDNTKLETWRK